MDDGGEVGEASAEEEKESEDDHIHLALGEVVVPDHADVAVAVVAE